MRVPIPCNVRTLFMYWPNLVDVSSILVPKLFSIKIEFEKKNMEKMENRKFNLIIKASEVTDGWRTQSNHF